MYAEAGIPVFPCVVEGKTPATPNGFKDATTDIDQITAWWGDGTPYNIGLEPERAGWCVVDIDGAEGEGSWFTLCEEHGEPSTRVVMTPNGGRHLYFKGSLPPSASKIGHKIDTRGRGSYVLVPPSVVNGREYRDLGGEPVELPAWVAERAGPSERAKPRAAQGEVELDNPLALAQARAAVRGLVAKYGRPVEGEGSDATTYAAAAMSRDYGVSEETCLDLLAEEWAPHFEREWLEEKIANAYRYGQNEPGNAGLQPSEWDAQAVAENPPPVVYPTIYTAKALSGMTFEPPQWIWQDRLLAFEPNLYTGDAGVGKTTLAENLAVAVAAGIPLLGADTMQQPVFLLVAEDAYGPVRDNLAAIRLAMKAPEGCLDDIHVLSVKDPRGRVHGGHRLCRIDDDGGVQDSAFMRECIAPHLAAVGQCLFVLDPLAEFVSFDRTKDEACRALATTWLYDVAQIGRVTPLVNDHPSKAAMREGFHYAGSTQLKAAFSLFATLIGGDWSGNHERQRELTFSVEKGRYAGEQQTKLVRVSSSPAFQLANGDLHAPDDNQAKVYLHILDRLDRGERTQSTDRGEYGPTAVAMALGMDRKTVDRAMMALKARGWLGYEARSGGGRQGTIPAGFTLGDNAVSRAELAAF